jgi:hypothetical protein
VFSTSLEENGVTLSSVLGEAAVNEMDKIVSDWNGENSWHSDRVGDF